MLSSGVGVLGAGKLGSTAAGVEAPTEDCTVLVCGVVVAAALLFGDVTALSVAVFREDVMLCGVRKVTGEWLVE